MIKELRNMVYDVDKKKKVVAALEPYVEKSKELARHKMELGKIRKGDLSSVEEFTDLVPIEHAEAEKFGFIKKYITKRKQYKEYKKSVSLREAQISENIKYHQDEIDSLEPELEEVYQKTGIKEEIHEYVEKLNEDIKNAESKKTPKDMGLTMDQVIELFKENGVSLLLTEEDKKIAENNRSLIKGDKPFKELGDFVLVHKTRFAPKEDEIRTSLNAGGMAIEEKKMDGIDYRYPVALGRDTVHFTVNGAVTSHNNGNWNDCRYAIYMKAQDVVDQGHIINASPQDTWTKGNVPINKGSFMICPESEVEEIQKQNPRIQVIGYKGDDAMGYDQMFVSMLGYSPREIGDENWKHEVVREVESKAVDTRAFREIFEREGTPTLGVHFESPEHIAEIRRERASAFWGLLSVARKTLEENKDIPIDDLKERLKTDYEYGVGDNIEDAKKKAAEIGIRIDESKEFLPQVFRALEKRDFKEPEKMIEESDIQETIERSNIHERLQETPENKKREVADVINEANSFEREEAKDKPNPTTEKEER